jgi:hypothetical protein
MALTQKRDTFTFTQTESATEWTIAHSAGTTAPVVSVWINEGSTAVAIIPKEIQIVDANNLIIKFSAAHSGTAVIG